MYTITYHYRSSLTLALLQAPLAARQVLNHQRAVKARWPGGNWAENQVRVFDMTSVEDFWRVRGETRV